MFNFCLIFQILLAVGGVLADTCTISMPTDLPYPQPVFITEKRLFRPITKVTELQEGEELILHCAGRSNVVVALRQQTVTLQCRNGKFYDQVKGKQRNLKNLKCSRVPTSELLVTGTACAGGAGVLYEVGFPVNDDFHSVFTICYDSENEHTIYSRSLVNGAALSFKINDSTRRSFRADGTRFSSTGMNNFYVHSNQRALFVAYFGRRQTYVTSHSFLARGHLAPDGDFIFNYEQLATYYYTNCAPEWQAVNAGNWFRVENAVRKLASELGSDLLTFTSTLGVLELANPQKNELIKIYLDQIELLPAPEWYYKIIMHPSLPADIVFITRNNPFENVGAEVEFCTNVCDRYNLGASQYKDSSRGYTFCCELNDFWANAMNDDRPNFDLPDGWSYKN